MYACTVRSRGVHALARQALVRLVVQDVVTAGGRSSSSGTAFVWAINSLSLVAVSDTNKLPMLEHGDTRACDACAAVLRWGTSLTSEAAPRAGASVPGASSSHRNWSSEILYAARRSAAETLFQLSLSQVGKGALLAHAACVQVIRHHAREKGSAVSAQCSGALRCLEGAPRADVQPPRDKHAAGKHVMLSYQWDSQEVVLRIVASLKQRGFAVWLDLEEMSGSTLDAMARQHDVQYKRVLEYLSRYGIR